MAQERYPYWTLKRLVEESAKIPSIFEEIHLPSQPYRENVFQSETLGTTFRPVFRGALSRLYTMHHGEISPRKVDILAKRVIEALARLNSRGDSFFREGVSKLYQMLDAHFGLELTDKGDGHKILTLTKSLDIKGSRKALDLLVPSYIFYRSNQHSTEFDRGATIDSIVFAPLSPTLPINLAIIESAAFTSPFSDRLKSLEFAGCGDKPPEVTNIDAWTHGSRAGRSIPNITIRNCVFKDPREISETNTGIQSVEFETPDITLGEITRVLPTYKSLKRLTILAKSASPSDVADLLAKVCKYVPNAEVSIRTKERNFTRENESAPIKEILSQLASIGAQAPTLLSVRI